MTLSAKGAHANRRRRLSPEARRKQLLQIGLKVFASLGLEGAGHANIARAANVSTATVFNYFPTRVQLTQALIGEIKTLMLAEYEKMIDAIDIETASPRARIYHAAATYDRLIETQPDLFKAFLMWSVSFNPELRQDYIDFQTDIVARLEQLLSSTQQHKGEYKGHGRVLFGAGNALALMRFEDYSTAMLTDYVSSLAYGLQSKS